MTTLSVNVNKIALLRNSRPGEVPSVTQFAKLALDSGAHGITIHPRPDQRHIRAYDVDAIAQVVNQFRENQEQCTSNDSRFVEFNIEGNPFLGDYVKHIEQTAPDQCTLVPDDPTQKTSDHGWNIKENFTRLKEIVAQLHNTGARVSLFMDPDIEQIKRAPETGAERIELYTESYAIAFAEGGDSAKRSYEQFARAAGAAAKAGLKVNAGHDLNLDNLGPFITILNIAEVSIGHALVRDALLMGFAPAIKAYLAAVSASKKWMKYDG